MMDTRILPRSSNNTEPRAFTRVNTLAVAVQPKQILLGFFGNSGKNCGIGFQSVEVTVYKPVPHGVSLQTSIRRTHRAWCLRAAAMLAGLGSFALGAGCSHQLTFLQEDYINTAIHWGRAPSQRTGEPLEINVVSVRAKDLKLDVNDRLKPESQITSAVWFANRPIPGDDQEKAEMGRRFYLPKSQILVMTYASEYYGTRIGDPLCGAVADHKKEIKTTVPASGLFGSLNSVTYVFAKFVDEKGKVLPVAPARIRSLGGIHDLIVEIGVDESRGNFGQYVEARRSE